MNSINNFLVVFTYLLAEVRITKVHLSKKQRFNIKNDHISNPNI